MKLAFFAFLLVILLIHPYSVLAKGGENNSFGAKCKEDPSCVVVGGTHILEWKSENPSNLIVVCVHGLGLCARAYKPLASDLSKEGIDGFGINVRGFGPDRVLPERERLDCVQTIDDVRSLLKSIREKEPSRKIFLIGESMGGALVLRLAAQNPDLVDGVICSAPAWKLLKFKRTIAKGVVELFLLPSKRPGMASRGIIAQATKDTKLKQHLLQDSSHKIKLSFGEARAFFKFISKTDFFANKLEKPILVIQGLEDKLVSPVSVATLFKRIPSQNKVLLIDANCEHLVLEEGGYDSKLLDYLVNWLKLTSKGKLIPTSIQSLNTNNLSAKDLNLLLKLEQNANN